MAASRVYPPTMPAASLIVMGLVDGINAGPNRGFIFRSLVFHWLVLQYCGRHKCSSFLSKFRAEPLSHDFWINKPTSWFVNPAKKFIAASGCPGTSTAPRWPASSVPGCANFCLCPKCPSVPLQSAPQRSRQKFPSSRCLPCCLQPGLRHSVCATWHRACRYVCETLHRVATSPAPGCSSDSPAQNGRSRYLLLRIGGKRA